MCVCIIFLFRTQQSIYLVEQTLKIISPPASLFLLAFCFIMVQMKSFSMLICQAVLGIILISLRDCLSHSTDLTAFQNSVMLEHSCDQSS